jgi:glycosyltransferase involved in cell wall biosynthesis
MSITDDRSPLISIILPTYNRSALIRESIASVFHQTYKNWELIIVDDGSIDDTEVVIADLADPRLKYFKKDHTGFIGITRNYGIKRSGGELIAFIDSDDLWRSDKLQHQVDLLNKYPEAFFVLSNGDQFGTGATPTPDYQSLFVGSLYLPILLEQRFCFYAPSFVFKKEVIKQIGMLDESVPSTRDIHFFFRLSWKFPGIFTNERLVLIRKHAESTSARYNVKAYTNSLVMYRELINAGALSRKQFEQATSFCYYKMGLHYLHADMSSHSLKSFLRFISIKPLHVKGWIRVVQTALLALRAKLA